MSYTDHTEIVNDALHALLIGEFKVPVKYERENGFIPDLRRGECIRYFNVSQDHISNNSDGEDRQFNYELDYWFNKRVITKTNFEKTVWERVEQLRQLLAENVTYQPSDYKWHDLVIDVCELVHLEDEDGNLTGESLVHFEFNMMRFCQWA